MSDDITLTIRSLGLTSGESFVLNETVKLWGIVGVGKKISLTEGGYYVVEVWRRTTPLGEDGQYEVTLVQLHNHAILWVAAGYLYADDNGDDEASIVSEEE